MRLHPRDLRQARLAAGILDRDHAPELQVGRTGRGLRRSHQRLQRATRQRVGQVRAHRAMREQGAQHFVEFAGFRRGSGAIAGLQQRSVAHRGLGGFGDVHRALAAGRY